MSPNFFPTQRLDEILKSANSLYDHCKQYKLVTVSISIGHYLHWRHNQAIIHIWNWTVRSPQLGWRQRRDGWPSNVTVDQRSDKGWFFRLISSLSRHTYVQTRPSRDSLSGLFTAAVMGFFVRANTWPFPTITQVLLLYANSPAALNRATLSRLIKNRISHLQYAYICAFTIVSDSFLIVALNWSA